MSYITASNGYIQAMYVGGFIINNKVHILHSTLGNKRYSDKKVSRKVRKKTKERNKQRKKGGM